MSSYSFYITFYIVRSGFSRPDATIGPLRVLKIHHRKVRKAVTSNRPAPVARSDI